jgi:hypothetical protein
MYQVIIELSSITLKQINLHLDKQAHFSTLHKLITNEFGEQHGFAAFVADNLNFMATIRELRNGFDHRQPKATAKDYQFNPDTTVSVPTITLNSKDAKLSEIPISKYLQDLTGIFSLSEVLICHLANITVKRMLGGEIREIPEEIRVYKNVRYCFYLPGLDFYQQ